jgi:hypothetical protein
MTNFLELHQIETKIESSDNLLCALKQQLNKKREDSLHKTENTIYSTILEIGKKVLQEYLDSLPETSEDYVHNPQGEKIPFKAESEREYLSIFGPVKIKRAYYWKKECGEGLCPLDQQLNLPEGKFSYALQDMTLRLIASQSYQEALTTIDKIFKIRLWPEAVKAMVMRAATYVHSFYKEIKKYEDTEGPIIAVTMDCKGIPMVPAERSPDKEPKQKKARREKGDKRKGLRRDAVVTSHFTFHPSPRTPEEMQKSLMRWHTDKEKTEYAEQKKERREAGQSNLREPINKQVHAAMDGKEKAFERLADQVLRRNVSQDKKLIVLIDGASSLENRFQEEMAKRKWEHRVDAYILDIFHATEYLWECGTALYGEKGPRRQQWVADKLLSILEGKISYVIGAIRQILTKNKRDLKESQKTMLEKVVTYFCNHKHMMKYGEYLKKGYPIGTGVIEGACGSLVKNRTDRSGMKWTHEGVQAILNLRAVNQNGDWDKYFAHYIDMERQRLYQSPTEFLSPGF